MSERTLLLVLSVLFFASVAKDITVPAVVLPMLACLRWLGSTEWTLRSMKGTGR